MWEPLCCAEEEDIWWINEKRTQSDFFLRLLKPPLNQAPGKIQKTSRSPSNEKHTPARSPGSLRHPGVAMCQGPEIEVLTPAITLAPEFGGGWQNPRAAGTSAVGAPDHQRQGGSGHRDGSQGSNRKTCRDLWCWLANHSVPRIKTDEQSTEVLLD